MPYMKEPAYPSKSLKDKLGGETTTEIRRKAAKKEYGATGMADIMADSIRDAAIKDEKAKRMSSHSKTPMKKDQTRLPGSAYSKPGWDKDY